VRDGSGNPFLFGLRELQLTNVDAKKIAADSPARAAGELWRGTRPNLVFG